ncbi:unnamed protein product, partial [Candidula unifasciata]
VVNLTNHRGFEKPDDEQYHVLPLYILDHTDELGSMEGQNAKVRSGALEILSHYVSQVRRRSTPYRPCKRNRTTPKKHGMKNSPKNSKLSRVAPLPTGHFSDSTFARNESNFCNSDGLLTQSSSLNKFNSVGGSSHQLDMVPGVGLEERNAKSMTYTDLMSQQGLPGFADLYTQFWDYFYTHGEFPPLEWTTKTRCSVLTEAGKSNFKSNSLKQSSAMDEMSLQQQKQQMWQHQEQLKHQKHNINVQSEQQEKQRQHNLLTCFPGKQGFQSPSPSPCLPHPVTSPRQQFYSHDYRCKASVLEAAQISPTPSSSGRLCQESFSHKSQYCSSASLPSSIPTSSHHQQYYSSQHLPLSSHPRTLSDPPKHNLFDNSENMQPSFFSSKISNNISLNVSSQNPTTGISSSGDASGAAQGDAVGHHLRPPPPYPDSVSNQYSVHGSAQNIFKPQGHPLSCGERVDQNVKRKLDNCHNAQGQITESVCASPDFMGGEYSRSLNQALKDLFSDNAEVSHPDPERPALPFEAQRLSLERSMRVSLGSRPASVLSHHTPISAHLEDQNVHIERPQSAQLPTISSSHSCEEPPLDRSVSRNIFMQSMSYPAVLQSPGRLELANPLSKLLCAPQTDEPDAVHTVKTHISNVSLSRSFSESHTSKLPSVQLLGRSQSYNVPVSQHGAQMSSSTHSDISHSSQLATSESSYQAFSPRADSVVEELTFDHNGSDLLTGVSSTSRIVESVLLDPPLYMSDDKQVKVRRDCWSRMSEPSNLTDAARPSSCFSEPDIASGWGKEHPFSLTARQSLDIQPSLGTCTVYNRFKSSKCLSSEVRNRCDDIHNTELQKTKHGVSNTKQEPNSTQVTPGGLFKPYSNLPWFQGQEKENGKSLGSVNSSFHDNDGIPLATCSSKPLHINHLETSPNIVTQCTNVDSSDEINSGNSYINRPVGSVCPNGPIIGEKMKVHKSEGFVVPKVSQSPSEPPYEVIDSTVVSVETDDNREVFDDPAMGGVAIALCHGAVLFEVAKRELHATTALKEPNRYRPKRISLVFYQHKNLNLTRHGFDEYERKAEERRSQAEQTRLIEEMESKGFFKGELSELAAFPSLTKGTFGKVFNFPEAKKTLFPLRFPRYLDCSHSEHITPVMFACMSIAFPSYMKEAFPDPSRLPRLMSGMPVKMYSSLSDKRKYQKVVDSDISKQDLQLLVDNYDKCGGVFHQVSTPWSPNRARESTATTNSVLTRWVHDDVNVTGPYNRWVELALQDAVKTEETCLSPKIKTEDETDVKMSTSECVPQHGQTNYNNESTVYPGTSPPLKSNTRKDHVNQVNSTVTTMVVNLDHSNLMSDLDLSQFSDRSSKMISPLGETTSVSIAKKCPNDFSTSARKSVDSSFSTDKSAQDGMVLSYAHPSESINASESGMTEPEYMKSELGCNTSLTHNKRRQESCKVRGFKKGRTFSGDLQSQNLLYEDHIRCSPINGHCVKSIMEDENLNCMEHAMDEEGRIQTTSKSIQYAVGNNTVAGSISDHNGKEHSKSIQYAVGNNTVAGSISDHNGKEHYIADMEARCLEESGSVSGKWESMYDFLMKGLSRPFLSSQQTSVQSVQDDLTNTPSSECP